MSAPYDVVVVGARVAGAATAMLLARAGARVALVDRSAPGTDTVSTHALMRTGVLQLHRWGVLGALADAGTPAIRRTLFHYRGSRTVQVSIRPSPGVVSLLAPRRTVIDPVLVAAAVSAGAELLDGAAVTGLTGSAGRVDGVRLQRPDGRRQDLAANLVVGADGVRSTVAREVAAPVLHQGRTASAVLYRYLDLGASDAYEWGYGDAAAAGLIPTNGGLTCLFVATTPDRMRRLRRDGTEAALAHLLRAAAPDLRARVAEGRVASRVHGWAGVPGFVRRSAGRGWALVGDAGYFKDPITTHGMTDALRDAELLARRVVPGLGGEVPLPAALRSYQRQRDRLSRGLRSATEEIAGYEWDLPRIQQLLREVSSSMTDELEAVQAFGAVGRLPSTDGSASPRSGADLSFAR